MPLFSFPEILISNVVKSLKLNIVSKKNIYEKIFVEKQKDYWHYNTKRDQREKLIDKNSFKIKQNGGAKRYDTTSCNFR